MAAPIIEAVRVGKRYRLVHHAGPAYATLREAVAAKARSVLQGSRGAAAEDFWALRDVDFEVPRGAVMGIIGRNGAGKSTLLKILSRITEPSEGRITLRGRVASLLEVGTGFHPELTGRENIFLNGAILGMTKAEITRKFDEIVAFAEVERFLDTPVKHYSSGMYVRLAFAVAAHLEPEILIVDEVLAVGDAQFQQKCLAKMENVAGEGRTVLLVSHNMAVIQQLTTTAILLHKGSVAARGATADVIAAYLERSFGHSTVSEDVRSAPRRVKSLSQQVRIMEVGFENKTTNIFEADEQIPLRVTVSAAESSQFRLSLTIYRSDGTPVGSVFSSDCFTVEPAAPAKAILPLRDLRLAEGHYHFAIATGIGDNTTGHRDYDIVWDVLPFQVMAEQGTGGTKAAWPPSWGPIRFPRPAPAPTAHA